MRTQFRIQSRTLLLRLAVAALVLLTARVVATGLAARHQPGATPVAAAGTSDRTPEQPRSDVVPPGLRAVRITVEPDWPLPAGSVVDVLAPPDPGPLGEAATTAPARVVAAGAVVLRQRPETGIERVEPGRSARTIILLVTLDGARQVAAAAAAGPLALALAPSEDACCRKSSSDSSRD